MAAETKKASGGTNNLVMVLLNGRTLIVLVILMIFFSLATPNFFTGRFSPWPNTWHSMASSPLA